MMSTVIVLWAARITVVLAAGCLVSRLFESRSAALAHRVLAVAVLSTVTLPLISWSLPTWDLPIADWAAGRAPADVAPTVFGDRPVESTSALNANASDTALGPRVFAPIEPDAGLPTAEVRGRNPRATTPAPSPIQTTSAAATDRHRLNWMGVALTVWAIGCALLFARLLGSIARLRRFLKACRDAPRGVHRLADDVKQRTKAESDFDVVVSRGNAMPMASWLGRSMIVLPNDFESWDEEVRETTLVHELGHIARHDAWTDFLVQFVRCVWWPHPLIWFAARDLFRLRERACDQWVLEKTNIGTRRYARCLLDVVKRCQSPSSQITTAMASTSDLESRLRWLVSSARQESPRPLTTSLASALVFAGGLAIATGQPTEPPSENGGVEISSAVTLTDEPTRSEPGITVHGVVVDTDNNPLHGMNVALRAKLGGQPYGDGFMYDNNRDVLARTTTDESGRFAMNAIGIPPRMVQSLRGLRANNGGMQLIVWGDGMAVGWEEVKSTQSEPFVIQLVAAANVSGSVVDATGKAIHNAIVQVQALTKSTDNIDGTFRQSGDLNLVFSQIRFETISRKGDFRLPYMPPDYRLSIRCLGPNGESGYFMVDTANSAPNSIRYQQGELEPMEVHRTPIRFKTESKPSVKIQVLDHTGSPVSGGAIQAVENHRFGGGAAVGENGLAHLLVRKPGPHRVTYVSDPLQPTVTLTQNIDIARDEGGPVVMQLPKTKWLIGRVVDSDTREPILGAYIRAVQSDDDEPVRSVAVSRADGVFRLPIMAGDWRLSFAAEVDGYLSPSPAAAVGFEMKPDPVQIVVAENGVPSGTELRLSRGLSIHGVVTGPSGRPLENVTVNVSDEGRPFGSVSTRTDSEGSYEASGLSPFSPTRVAAFTDRGAVERLLPAFPNQPWDESLRKAVDLVITTGTTLTGRVTKDDEPVSGITVRLLRCPAPKPGQDSFAYRLSAETTTDETGRYRVSGLKKGDRYRVEILADGDYQVRDWPHQSPYVQTVPDDETTIELPDAELVSNSQRLSGVVVDRSGSPIEGITVSANLASGGMLARPLQGAPPWATTDSNGRFSITNLPTKPIELMAFRANPKGGRIRYASRLKPELNADKIRILMDPDLGTDIEDLDAK